MGLLKLNLADNAFTGSIPPKLGSLWQLSSLNLSNNNLSGDIPTALSDCMELLILNLSYNKLSGNIPDSLANLHNLDVLDLSYNQLEGSVPDSSLFNNASITDLRGNLKLCGVSVHIACNTTSNSSTSRTVDREFSRRTLIIVVTVSAILVAGILFVSSWLCWRCKVKTIDQTLLPSFVLYTEPRLNLKADELREATNCFSEENVLGRGSVSTVYRAVVAGGKMVAVKVFKDGNGEANRFKREVGLLAKVRHRNIVRILGCCVNLDVRAIILEFMPNGNLDEYLHGTHESRPNNELDMDKKLNILRGVAHGLEYLHDRHPEGTIVHCDIKPANILIDEDFEPHISDFGIAKLLNCGTYEESLSLVLRGSVGYIPPEYGQSARVSTMGDIYSFGVVMMEVLTGKRPNSNELAEEGHDLVSWVRSANPQMLPSMFSAPNMSEEAAVKITRLAIDCTSDLPSTRPSVGQIAKFLMDLLTKGDVALANQS